MEREAIIVDQLPEIEDGVLIAGFEGWGNALDVSKGAVSYLVRKLGAAPFGRINPDLFYRFDETRPHVHIRQGSLKELSPPGGTLYCAPAPGAAGSLVLLGAGEPSFAWYRFVDALYALCERLRVRLVITVGSMYDSVLHSDRIISGFASRGELLDRLRLKGVIPIDYQGPSAIHSMIHHEGAKRGIDCVSLWCHCPYYLQGATHFGLLAELCGLLGFLGGMRMDTEELELAWRELSRQIQSLVEKNPDLQTLIAQVREARVKGSWENVKEARRRGDKVISIMDFIRPK
jgi:proteasome assembly chaperone (PAC2) family protein